MTIHFYDESPSPPGEQLARLRAGSLLVRAEIPFVVWGEDALSIVHRVPTALFDQHLLIQDDRVANAVDLICNELHYSPTCPSSDDRWRDHAVNNPARPFAFGGTPTTLLQHNDQNILQGCGTCSFVGCALLPLRRILRIMEMVGGGLDVFLTRSSPRVLYSVSSLTISDVEFSDRDFSESQLRTGPRGPDRHNTCDIARQLTSQGYSCYCSYFDAVFWTGYPCDSYFVIVANSARTCMTR